MYIMIIIINNNVKRCLHKKDYFPPERPIECVRPHPVADYALECCKSVDRCNLLLDPQLATTPDPYSGKKL